MTTTKSIGASSVISYDAWKCIPWVKAKKQIFRLQMRIAKATRQGKYGRVKALQRILTHSYYAKCLAVKRVTANKGAKTPGVDHVLWKSDRRKVQAVLQLQCKGYKPLPLKRVYIPKKSGKLRPLSIPTMKQ